ncbi:3-hydroxyacyl-CoA dehydrogenase/enoyl-CoA hydratase family protein [Tepidiphilus sp. J10]|uniref:3-hydroxyacyl-CoA dehydrogenase/enoyl-CoA hydratase family protein n=1 Tax=Tepidiphilus sp. J10 TaxID=2502185 RepID=UPI00115D31EE
MERMRIRKVAVLGAGVMGAQIAAHCANADLPVVLFDLPSGEGDRNATVLRALEGLKRLDPAPLAESQRLGWIQPANYDDDLEALRECDLVIEAIAERLDWKQSLYERVAPFLAEGVTLASNTSGLSITALAQALPEAVRRNFCGIHFFNPPRYLPLVELVPHAGSDAARLDALEGWLTTRLGKSVIRAKDTPNFIANRVGVFSILAVMHHTQRLGLGFDEVDALTGPRIGRPKSATYRTADVVGLDTLAHVIGTMQTTLPDDPWHEIFRVPPWLEVLIRQGALGQKSGAGVYRKEKGNILVLDLSAGTYRPAQGEVAPEVEEILALRDVRERFARLRASGHPQAQFLWALFRDVFHYCAFHLATIADSARDVDLAMRWGFGWAMGPFETWQAAGWRDIARSIEEDRAAGLTLANVPLPAWVEGLEGTHSAKGSWSAARSTWVGRSSLAVYRRQLYPDRVLGERFDDPGETLWENEGVRLWRRPDQDQGVGIVSVRTRHHTLGAAVIEGILEAVARAERELDALVLWHEAPFALGADLKQVLEAAQAGRFDQLETMVERFQQASMRLKHAEIPVVAAIEGMALGGGCEFALHAAHRVFALESYVGLVEVGVGLIPAGGGCKELAIQAHRMARRAAGGDVFAFIQPMFEQVAKAKVSRSALEAQAIGYGRAGDDVLMHPKELLYAAIRRARSLAEAGYRPPLPEREVVVAGRNGIATCEMMLVNMREGGFISEHDYRVGKGVATALCGGEVESGARVPVEWLLAVERREFMALLRTPQTLERIAHTLATGKPLRN